MSKKIEEALSGFPLNSQYKQQSQFTYPKRGHRDSVPTKSRIKPINWTEWQRKVIARLESKQDILVNVAPAAGKTSPIIHTWVDMVVRQNPNTLQQVPKIIWSCPTRQLANQVFFEDFLGTLYNKFVVTIEEIRSSQSRRNIMGIIQKNIPSYLYHQLPQTLRQKIEMQTPLEQVEYQFIQKIIRKNITQLTKTSNEPTRIEDAMAITCTEYYTEDIVRKVKNLRILVLDEIQEYFYKSITVSGSQMEYQGQSVEEKAKRMLNTIKNMPSQSQCSLVLLTGSMNVNSTYELIDIMNNQFRRNLVPVDPKPSEDKEARNRSDVNLKIHSGLRTKDDVVQLVKNIVNQKQNGSLIILFSIGGNINLNIRRKNIHNITIELQKTLPRLMDFRKTPKEQRTHIEKELAQMHAPNSGRDPFLAECLMRGFGYIFGGGKARIKAYKQHKIGGTPSEGMHGDDIRIVQDLFQKGLIYCVLATDAVGVGANLKVNHLYLSSLEKYHGPGQGPGGQTFGPLDDSSLIQLINRAGRQTGKVATIYTNSDDYERVKEFLQSDPQSVVSPVNVGKQLKQIDRNIIIKRVANILKLLGS